jgi:hypothetical protein
MLTRRNPLPACPHRREARERQEALRMATAFEAQLAELEAAAAAAEATASAGAAARTEEQARAQRERERAGAEMLLDALAPLEAEGSGGGLPPDLLELIGALERDPPGAPSARGGAGPAAPSSSGSNGNGGGGGGGPPAPPQLSAAEAVLQRELELLQSLKAPSGLSGGGGGGGGGDAGGGGSGGGKRKKKRR